MTKRPILQSQANELFTLIAKAGLRPVEFSWNHSEGAYLKATLTHNPTQYFFEFRFEPNTDFGSVRYSPAAEKLAVSTRAPSWHYARLEIEEWVTALAREVNEPDLWVTVATESQLIESVGMPQTENLPFDAAERQRIQLCLIEIREYLASTQSLSEGQLETVNARLAYLEGASERLGRKDWMVIALGTFTNIVITASFAPAQTHELFQFAGRVLSWVLEHRLFLP
jgi:hypothetical protein